MEHYFSNLTVRNRSHIRWQRYRQFVIYGEEYQDYNGEWYSFFGAIIDGEWIADAELEFLHRLIDEWYEDLESNPRWDCIIT